ncbi:peptidase C14 caspase catalytic subunit p20 [Calothrix sp. NIES-4071]|nr:peptidase C14 caspase catalytic subunit p20 [Calothrix sp. NIES-4071]BAZ55253.1 peptidase C14 caspase catalytic subunit p20 [Calothrix sp. NIES-4105]
MNRNIYALLIGIDEYVSPIIPLRGCVNDINEVKAYLEARVQSDGYQLHLRTLLNKNATRQAVIDGFRQHLCQAGSEDVAFLYYSGHGSQQQAPQEFWNMEPDRMNETIVCYDSRSPGSWDLADKELAKLIAEVAKENPHITIIMDCCHSSSGTRGDIEADTTVRLAPIDKRRRPLDSFICSDSEQKQLLTQRSMEKNTTDWIKPSIKYIFLAACRDCETAKEYNVDGESRGAFSYFLLDTLKKANGSLTYKDLFKCTNALIRCKVAAQSPQLEAAALDDLEQPFLGGAIANCKPYFCVCYHKDYGWIIDGGAVHGIPKPHEQETTVLALFPSDSSPFRMQKLSEPIGKARVIKVMPHLSQVQISGIENLQPEMNFKAVVTDLALPPKGVLITGEETGVKLARAALLAIGFDNRPSLYLQEVTTPDAEFKLLALNGQYLITRPADNLPIVAQIEGYTEATALLAIQRLEHISRWTYIAELSSPANSSIEDSAVQMVIYQEEEEVKDTTVRFEYQQQDGLLKSPTFKIKLKNTFQRELFCALLNMTCNSYSVSPELLETGGVWLKPGEEAWANGGKDIYPTVPENLWKQGITESQDILKLIVSTNEFDATLLRLTELDLPSFPERQLGRGCGTLNRLIKRVQSRELRAAPEEKEYDDWITYQIKTTTVRSQNATLISGLPKKNNYQKNCFYV